MMIENYISCKVEKIPGGMVSRARFESNILFDLKMKIYSKVSSINGPII